MEDICELSENDVEVLLFVNKYKYVRASDFKYLYPYKRYYQTKISKLVHNNYLRKIKWYIVLGTKGKEHLESIGQKCSRISYKESYVERQKIISSFAARYYNNDTVKFISSVDLKDKDIFTIKSRRFIGIIKISNKEYLTYYISKEQSHKYIQSIIYDIQKERQLKNIIIFVEDLTIIEIKKFIFGLDEVFIIPYTEENIYLLENMFNINYQQIFQKLYKNKVYLSEYNFCDYYTLYNQYIYPLVFIDTEKLSTIKYFKIENKEKNVDILLSKNISLMMIGRIKDVNYKVIDYTKYIRGEIRVYD